MKVLRGSSFTVDEMDKAFGHFTDYVERESRASSTSSLAQF